MVDISKNNSLVRLPRCLFHCVKFRDEPYSFGQNEVVVKIHHLPKNIKPERVVLQFEEGFGSIFLTLFYLFNKVFSVKFKTIETTKLIREDQIDLINRFINRCLILKLL